MSSTQKLITQFSINIIVDSLLFFNAVTNADKMTECRNQLPQFPYKADKNVYSY